MEFERKRPGSQDLPLPATKLLRVNRPTYLKIRLSQKYVDLLPDLLLLEVPRVEHVQHNDIRTSYLYKLCSLLLDRSPAEIELYTTSRGDDSTDDNESWMHVANDDTQFEGGVYFCRLVNGMKSLPRH